ncbi:MAG TPA: glycosyltransferase [Opitutaceae bacterium]|nr:glycosyltransferase [Opitutaceae bacterium]
MNILFVNYGDFTTNSLNHIGGFANALSAAGNTCIVAVPSGKDTLSGITKPTFAAASYNELLAKPALFPDGRGADVIHAWTPRECVRKFVVSYQAAVPVSARLAIHLEDNEEHLISGYSGRTTEELRELGHQELDSIMSDRLPHPLKHRTFLRLADAVTVIIERLKEFVPAGIPSFVLNPGVDPEYTRRPGPAPSLRRELGVADDEKLIVFTGSNTFANEPEMLDLYRAVALLNERGIPTRLVRTGFNRPEFLASLTPQLKAHVSDLGFIAKSRLPSLLAAADVLVQPGKAGAFNDYRLPSKVPEFLASGRPVVLPPTNVALGMTDGVEAIFLKRGDPSDIADCCALVFSDPSLASRLGEAGAVYAAKHFDLATNAAVLAQIYAKLKGAPAKPCWAIIKRSSGSDVTVAARELADRLKSGGHDAISDLASLADDLAEIVRIDDARQTAAVAARDSIRLQLEETVRHLELQRELTTQHSKNLEEKIGLQDKHIKLQKKLSDRHIQNLEARIGGIERIARQQRETRESVLQTLHAAARSSSEDRARLSRQIGEMDTELRAREARLKAIVHSVSYKLAAPSRDIEKFCHWVAAKFRSKPRPKAVPAVAPAQAAAVELPPAEAPQETGPSYHYTFNVDHPLSWNTASSKLLILGWCYENSGAPITGIRATFAGETFDGIYGSKRLDVLASTGMKQAEYCGIKVDVRTHLGDHLLVVEVKHEDGWHPLFQKLVHVGKAGDPTELSDYEKWCEQHEALSEGDLAAIKGHIEAFSARPVVSVLMPVYNPPEGLLDKAIQSVLDQVYPHWELCIADDASTDPAVRLSLEKFAAADSRIRVTFRAENGHICDATNSALSLASGDLIALFDHDDLLAPVALYEVASEYDAHPEAQIIYSDEDKIDVEDRRFDPYFKPDWNPDLNYGQNYLSHLTVYKAELIRGLAGFRKGYEGSQDWDLILRAIERVPGASIRHIPKLLYHWRAVPGSTALQLAEKSYPVEAARRALTDHFERTGQQVSIHTVPGDHWRIKYPIPSPAPLVSLIVPTRNALNLVRQAVTSLLEKTDYPNYEIIVVDNGSDDPETISYFAEISRRGDTRVRVLPYHAPFNYSAINNFAVREANGEIIGLLNNDVEAINPEWLTEMVSQASRPGIGAVGAMLYYPLNTVQHAGVILGLGGVAGHPFKEFPRGDQGQKNRLRLVQNYSAVTAACLLICKERFLEVGGFNEKDLPVAFNDVDLCCKLISAGYRNLWTPYAEFYHHESATRGVEDTPEKKARFQSEIDYMMNTWGSLLMADPAYNPNLTLVGEDFSPAYLSRAQKSWAGHLV